MVIAAVGIAASRSKVPAGQAKLVSTIIPAADVLPIANGSGGSGSVTTDLGSQSAANLTPAQPGAVAIPAPATVTDQPPLKPHEVFGFAPYWTLADSSEFDLNGLTTVDYFSIGINANGSIAESGPGWDGYESQDFIGLIDRAHAAGDRVVLTVNDFSQSSLDGLASSQSAPQTLAQNLLALVRAKSLDGVNLDLEGEGSGDQSGITNVVKVVASALRAANPDYQLTMDTYASSAGDPSGFYDIPALSHEVDGFFVMAYQLNLRASANADSPLTSSMFSNQTTVNQYADAAPAAKVILGLPVGDHRSGRVVRTLILGSSPWRNLAGTIFAPSGSFLPLALPGLSMLTCVPALAAFFTLPGSPHLHEKRRHAPVFACL